MATAAYPVSDPAAARQPVAHALEAEGFAVTWADDWNAEAEIGSSGMVLLAGGFKPHIKLQVAFTASDEGAWVQVIQATTGAAGGALGMSKTKKKWRATVDGVSGGLHAAGLLTGSPQEA